MENIFQMSKTNLHTHQFMSVNIIIIVVGYNF